MTPEEFLTARIAEAEALAHEAEVVIDNDLGEHRIAEWWDKPEHGRVYAGHWYRVVQAGVTDAVNTFYNTAALPHIALWDPHHVLVECEVTRAIMALHSAEPGQHPDFCGHDLHQLPCPTLRLLGTSWADHPDYAKVEW